MTRQGRWKAVEIYPIRRLKGQILGIVGFGRITQVVARKATCLGLKVMACDPYMSAIEMNHMHVEKVELNELVSTSDIITLHVLLTDETFHLFNTDMFNQMKNATYLINTCRGEVVDEAVLIKALKEEQIAGAGLDVLSQEPPDPQNPLLYMPNVIVTPHSAYTSQEEVLLEVRKRATQAVIDTLEGNRGQGDIISPEVF